MRKERAECVGGEENYFAQILNEADEWPSQCVKKSSEHLLSCLDTQRLRFCFWAKLCRNCANETQIERELAKDSPGFAKGNGRLVELEMNQHPASNYERHTLMQKETRDCAGRRAE